MGEARRNAAAQSQRLKVFLKSHPYCCFCGGLTIAETFDHVPARSIFNDRQWPESYEFPACLRCNKATSGDEEVIAILSRLGLSEQDRSPAELDRFRRLLRSMRERRPELLAEMWVGSRGARDALRKRNLVLPAGSMYRDLPLIAVNGPLVQSAVRSFARKLGLALHYKHTGLAVPPTGALWMRWWTNWSVQDDAIPSSILTVAPELPEVIRNRVDLSNQFSYRWGPPGEENPEKLCFLAVFRQSFAIVIFAGADSAQFEPIPPEELLRPFRHF
jgi:hypothetical protein